MKRAIIDIGSNSVRLYLQNEVGGRKIMDTTMLARGMTSGYLHADSIARTVAAVASFISMARVQGYGEPAVFATEAVRAAKNREEFIRQLSLVTTLPLDVLTGEEEATVAYLGALSAFLQLGHTDQSKCRTLGVIDIGGASVEYAMGTIPTINNSGQGYVSELTNEIIEAKQILTYKKSLPMGAIVLKNKCGDDREQLDAYIKEMLKTLDKDFKADVLMGVSGTLTTLAAMDLNLEEYDPTRVHGHVLEKQRLVEFKEEIYSSNELLTRYKTLKQPRLDILKQGISIITNLLTFLTSNRIIISESDNLEGYSLFNSI